MIERRDQPRGEVTGSETRWTIRCASLVFATIAIGGAGCGGPSASGGGCHYDSWQGKCALQSVRTARLVERFPKSFVVVEAVYEPQSTEGQFSPPPFRKETVAPAEYELDLSDHLRKYPLVDCSVQNPVGDPCAPTLAASVPEFVPPTKAVVANVAVGCAKIEHSDTSATLATPVTLPGPFQFDENSAAEDAAIRQLADDAAAAIAGNPRIECVAIKGNSAPGESFSLANDRAQAVRRLLEARGIDHSRVTVFEATAPSYTASPDDQPVLAEHRRVHLAVVVYTNEQANK